MVWTCHYYLTCTFSKLHIERDEEFIWKHYSGMSFTTVHYLQLKVFSWFSNLSGAQVPNSAHLILPESWIITDHLLKHLLSMRSFLLVLSLCVLCLCWFYILQWLGMVIHDSMLVPLIYNLFIILPTELRSKNILNSG